jgi:hypothetical protein
MRSGSADVRVELNYLRDGLLQAIRDGRTASVEAGLLTYEEIVAIFLDQLAEHSARYTSPREDDDGAWLRGGWSEIEWIDRDLQELLEAAVQLPSRTVVHSLMGLPFGLAGIGARRRDTEIYGRFVRSIERFYFVSQGSSEYAELLRDRSWRLLVELAEYVVSPQIESAPLEELGAVGDLAATTLIALQELLKAAFDDRDQPMIIDVVRAVGKAFDSSSHGELAVEFANLRFHEGASIDNSDAELPASAIRARMAVALRVAETKVQIFFAMSAWDLRKYVRGEIDADFFRSTFSAFPVTHELGELWRIWRAVRDYAVERGMGWMWWELEEHPDGEVFSSSGFTRSLDLAFVVHAVAALSERPSVGAPASLEPDRLADILTLGSPSTLDGLLDEFVLHRPKLLEVLPHLTEAAVQTLRGLIEATGREERRRRAEHLIAKPLSAVKVDSAATEAVAAWRQASTVRALLVEANAYLVRSKATTAPEYFGISRYERKEAFVDEPEVAGLPSGREWGRAIAIGENRVLLRDIAAACSQHMEVSTVADAIKAIRAYLRQSRKRRIALLMSGSWGVSAALRQEPDFTSTGDRPGQIGMLGRVPVFEFQGVHEEPTVIVGSVRHLGRLIQFGIEASESTERIIDQTFLYSVRQVDPSVAADLAHKSPEFAKRIGAGELSEADAIAEIRQQVHVRLLERFVFERAKQSDGLAVRVPEGF